MTAALQSLQFNAQSYEGAAGSFDPLPRSSDIVNVATLIHDLNNQIQCATSAIGLLRGRLQTGSHGDLSALAQSARLALLVAGEMAGRLCEDECASPTRDALLDVGETLTRMVPILRIAAGDHILLTCSADVLGHNLMCDAHGLEASILNLVLNAKDALAKGGHIAITANLVLSASAGCEPPADAHICLAVQDNGGGMPDHIRDSACKPYVSTKGTGATRGLGLASVKSFVDENDGWLTIDSELGRGTAVQLFLPAATA